MEVAGIDVEEDVVLRTKELAERGADLAVAFLSELGCSPATIPRSSSFLSEISALAQVREWERHGLAESLGSWLPSYSEALLDLVDQIEQGVASGKPLSPNLSKLVMRVGLENLAWNPSEIGEFATVTGEFDEDAMLEAFAELIWNNRHLLDSADTEGPSDETTI